MNVPIQHSEKTPLVTLLCSTTARGNVVKEVCRRPKQQQQQPKAGQQEHSMLHNARVVAEKKQQIHYFKNSRQKKNKRTDQLIACVSTTTFPEGKVFEGLR